MKKLTSEFFDAPRRPECPHSEQSKKIICFSRAKPTDHSPSSHSLCPSAKSGATNRRAGRRASSRAHALSLQFSTGTGEIDRSNCEGMTGRPAALLSTYRYTPRANGLYSFEIIRSLPLLLIAISASRELCSSIAYFT